MVGKSKLLTVTLIKKEKEQTMLNAVQAKPLAQVEQTSHKTSELCYCLVPETVAVKHRLSRAGHADVVVYCGSDTQVEVEHQISVSAELNKLTESHW